MHIQDQIHYNEFDDEHLGFYKAIGVDMICLDIRAIHKDDPTADPRTGGDCTGLLESAKAKVESHGMALYSVFMSGWDEITLALPDRDEKIDAWCEMLLNLGKAGIQALGYNFKPKGNFRTTSAIGRGGARYSTFNYHEFSLNRPEPHEPTVSEEEMYARIDYFLERVIPVAEAAGVRMALHPDDPPIPEPLAGVAQIVSSPEQYRRIFDVAPSRSNGMLFCQGCFTEMGVDVYDAIREMATAERIVYVHFRNVRSALPVFQEVFMDEGDVDMLRALEVYRDAGFNGPFMMDHTPNLPQAQAGWAGRAFAVGHIRGLIHAVYGK